VLTGLIETHVSIIIEAVLIIHQAAGSLHVLLHESGAGQGVPVMSGYVVPKLHGKAPVNICLTCWGGRGVGGQLVVGLDV